MLASCLINFVDNILLHLIWGEARLSAFHFVAQCFIAQMTFCFVEHLALSESRSQMTTGIKKLTQLMNQLTKEALEGRGK